MLKNKKLLLVILVLLVSGGIIIYNVATAEKTQDEKYGKGFSEFFNSAVEYYLKNLK